MLLWILQVHLFGISQGAFYSRSVVQFKTHISHINIGTLLYAYNIYIFSLQTVHDETNFWVGVHRVRGTSIREDQFSL